jgi:methionine-rich copper-binding protein CopC
MEVRSMRWLTELDVVSVEVVNLRLGEHSVVFKFCSSDGGAVVGN